MCGRFSLASNEYELYQEFGIAPNDYRPRYNIAPTQPVLIVGRREQGDVARWYRWGLIPSWAKDADVGNRMINARRETIDQRRAYRDAFERRRCLVVADGFYEWRREGGSRTPMRIRLESGAAFGFAGLWERWRAPDGEWIRSCAIVTTAADDFMRPIHDRMPVVLTREARELWLDPATPPQVLREALAAPAPARDAYAVSRLVNSPDNDLPDCILPVEPPLPDLRLL